MLDGCNRFSIPRPPVMELRFALNEHPRPTFSIATSTKGEVPSPHTGFYRYATTNAYTQPGGVPTNFLPAPSPWLNQVHHP